MLQLTRTHGVLPLTLLALLELPGPEPLEPLGLEPPEPLVLQDHLGRAPRVPLVSLELLV